MQSLDALKTLVRIDSTSSVSNHGVLDVLSNWLEDAGFRLTRQVSPSAVPKSNLIATAGPRVDPIGSGGLAFVGHTDTVPFDPEWTEALTPVVKNERLYARGACDTKAFIAAACTAAVNANLQKLRQALTLVFTYDEEVGCIGAKQLLDERFLSPKYAVVGEPTSLRPIYANKGYCLARVTVLGKEGHSAYPDVGVNAIFQASKLLQKIETIRSELREAKRGAFDPPFTTVNVGVIQGGKAKNMITGSCEFILEWRPLPDDDAHDVYERVVQAAESLHSSDVTFEVEMEQLRVGAGAATPPDSPIVRYLAEEAGTEPGTVAFGTEAPEMNALGAESVVFGPGDIQVAHKTGEFVPLTELDTCTQILGGAIERFCLAGV